MEEQFPTINTHYDTIYQPNANTYCDIKLLINVKKTTKKARFIRTWLSQYQNIDDYLIHSHPPK